MNTKNETVLAATAALLAPNNTTTSNVQTVRDIGAAEAKIERLTSVSAAAIVATLPEGFDAAKRGAITGAVHTWACGEADRPAVATGPKGEQTRTNYGRGVDALSKAVKALVTPDATPEVGVIRVSLSGEGGATVTLRKGDKAYDAALAMITAAKS